MMMKRLKEREDTLSYSLKLSYGKIRLQAYEPWGGTCGQSDQRKLRPIN